MKRSFTLTLATLAVSLTAHGQSLNINGTSYAGYFSPAGAVTVSTAVNGLLDISVGGNASGSLNSYWTAQADGGAVLAALGVPLARTGAQVSLTGSSLEFNISNNTSVLGALGIGTSLGLDWSATSKFNVGGNQLVLAPNTTYQVTFDLASGSGLLNSTLGITPHFNLQLLDGAGTAVGTASSGSLVNVLGLSLVNVIGAPTPTETATVQFTTGSSVGSGAASLVFSGDALVPVTALGIGTNFATVSNVGINAVPESSSLAIVALGGLLAIRRRR
jgi:hypothetical protein